MGESIVNISCSSFRDNVPGTFQAQITKSAQFLLHIFLKSIERKLHSRARFSSSRPQERLAFDNLNLPRISHTITTPESVENN